MTSERNEIYSPWRVGTAPPPIPADQSELTPGWLTQVLRRAGAIKAGRVAGLAAHLEAGADHVAVNLITAQGDDPVVGYTALAGEITRFT